VARAAGGPIFGPGTGTSDSVPAMLSAGEHVWTAAEVQAAGGHGAVEAMRRWVKTGQRFADGGRVGVPAAVAAAPAPGDWGRIERLLEDIRDRPAPAIMSASQAAAALNRYNDSL